MLLGCSEESQPGNTTLPAEGYNTTCKAAGECVVVTFGGLCGCVCPARAINRADEPKYTEARAQISCPADSQSRCGQCLPMEARCNGGTCAAERSINTTPAPDIGVRNRSTADAGNKG